MKITTRNTVYTFKDLGDGAFEVVNRDYLVPEDPRHQDILPVGTGVWFYHEPEEGQALWGTKIYVPGNQEVGIFHTSTVREVEL